MTPGIIKKLYHTTPVGLTDEDKQEVYPITATSAVYSAPGESSFPNMSLDNILDALNQGYQYMGKAIPTTNPGVYNHKVFYLASDPGTYSYFGNIEVSSLTVLKTSGNGWTADVFNITGGGGGGGTAAGYIGTTLVQSSPAPQNLGGISQLNLTSGARIYFGETAYIELDQYGFHFSQGIYSDSFVAAGGIGSGGGGGGGYVLPIASASTLGGIKVGSGLSIDANGVLSATGGGGSGTVTDVKMNGTTHSPVNGVVDLGTVITSLSGYATQSWVQQRGYLTTETDPTVPSWAKTVNPLFYIGTTQVQTSSASQALTGILSVKNSTNNSLFEWDGDNNAWHFYGNLYTDGWVSAGGIGSGSSGGSVVTISNLLSSGTRIATITINGTGYDILAPQGGSGTVTRIDLGSTQYSPVNGVVSLPAYPTTLPASDVYAWAKAATKPSYTLDEIADGTTRKLSNYLPLTGGTMTGDIVMSGANIVPSANNTCGLGTSSARFANIYGVDADLSSGLSVSETGHIDLGPIRIKYDATNKALHITKKSITDINTYGFYVDGFVSAGGVGQTS